MDDKVIFLGVGGDTTATAKQEVGSGGIILISEGIQFHIDPGPGAVVRAKMYGVNVRETTAILVSHSHLNHCNDVNALIAACSYAGIDKNAVLIASRSVVEPDENNFSVLTPFHKQCVERVIMAEPGKRIGIGRLEVHTLHTKHHDDSAIGFKIFTSDYTIGIPCDTEYFKTLGDELKGCDILILNIKEPMCKSSVGNLSADDAVKILNQVKPNLLVITHYGMKMLQENPIHVAREIFKQTQVQVIAAKDGMIINPKSHSSIAKQKTLIQYK